MKRFIPLAGFTRSISILALTLSLLGGFNSQLQAQLKPVTLANLKEEQRKADIAYLNEAEAEIRTARERLGSNEPRLAQISGFRALAKLGKAREILDPHPERIEELRRLLNSESSRKDLRANYTKVRDRYNAIEERIQGIAEALAKVGYPILKDTLAEFRAASSPEAAMKVIGDNASKAGVSGGDIPPSAKSPNTPTNPVNNTSTAVPSVPAGFTVAPGGGGVTTPSGNTIRGTVLADGKIDGGPGVGIIDLKSRQVNKDGVEFFQTSEGVWMIPPGILIRGAKLNPDGTITFLDGTTSSIDDVKRNADGTYSAGRPPRQIEPSTGRSVSNSTNTSSNPAPSSTDKPFSDGKIPEGTRVTDQNGNEITITRPFKDGVALDVTARYRGPVNTLLLSEEKIEVRVVSSQGKEVKVNRSVLEKRLWSLQIDFVSTLSENGKNTGTIGLVDAAGGSGLVVKTIEVVAEDGANVSVQRSSDDNTHTVTFTKSGDYTVTATGTTEWGSEFKIVGIQSIGL
jgi:hypothetical protein